MCFSGLWDPDDSCRQRHVSIAIFVDGWRYWHETQDREFLESSLAEMMLSISIFWQRFACGLCTWRAGKLRVLSFEHDDWEHVIGSTWTSWQAVGLGAAPSVVEMCKFLHRGMAVPRCCEHLSLTFLALIALVTCIFPFCCFHHHGEQSSVQLFCVVHRKHPPFGPLSFSVSQSLRRLMASITFQE